MKRAGGSSLFVLYYTELLWLKWVVTSMTTFCLQGRSTGNDLNQLSGNDGLTGTVEQQRQLTNHFT